jgi:signal transduction histidine kinase
MPRRNYTGPMAAGEWGCRPWQLRCRMIGADLSIDSEAGKGTRLAIRVPCPNPKAIQ